MGEDKGKKETIKVNVTGMHCTSCAMNIENKLKEKEGINQANVSYSTGQANIEYSPEKIDKKEILDSIEESGYKGFFIHEEEAEYATDPITGMRLLKSRAIKKNFGGRDYYFADEHSLKKFQSPEVRCRERHTHPGFSLRADRRNPLDLFEDSVICA